MYNKMKVYQIMFSKIDADAEREGLALKKQGRYTQSKYQYIRQQTEDYNTERLNKLFKR